MTPLPKAPKGLSSDLDALRMKAKEAEHKGLFFTQMAALFWERAFQASGAMEDRNHWQACREAEYRLKRIGMGGDR